MEGAINAAFFLGSLICSVTLFVRKRTFLRGTIALLFFLPFLIEFIYFIPPIYYFFIGNDLYDHGTAGEFWRPCVFMVSWSLLVMSAAVLLSRQERTLSIVFPMLFFLTVIPFLIDTVMTLQSRSDNYYYFTYYSYIHGQMLNAK